MLVVIGKYVSELNYLTVLLSDEPALSKDMSLYQRLLAQDDDEAERMVATRLAEAEPTKIYDEMLVPSLFHLRKDHYLRTIDQEEVKEVQDTMQAIVVDIADTMQANRNDELKTRSKPIPVLAFALRDPSDHLSLEMLEQILDDRKWKFELAPANTLISEVMDKLSKEPFQALLLGAIQPMNTTHLRHLCKKIRSQHQNVKIMIGLWGPDKVSDSKTQVLKESGADWVGNSLEEATNALAAWYPVWSEQPSRQVA